MVYTAKCKRPFVVAPEKTEEFMKLKRDEKVIKEIEERARKVEEHFKVEIK